MHAEQCGCPSRRACCVAPWVRAHLVWQQPTRCMCSTYASQHPFVLPAKPAPALNRLAPGPTTPRPAPLLPGSYLDDLTPERVDAQGVANVVAAAAKYLPRTQRSVEDVLSMRSASDIAKWQRCAGGRAGHRGDCLRRRSGSWRAHSIDHAWLLQRMPRYGSLCCVPSTAVSHNHRRHCSRAAAGWMT